MNDIDEILGDDDESWLIAAEEELRLTTVVTAPQTSGDGNKRPRASDKPTDANIEKQNVGTEKSWNRQNHNKVVGTRRDDGKKSMAEDSPEQVRALFSAEEASLFKNFLFTVRIFIFLKFICGTS